MNKNLSPLAIFCCDRTKLLKKLLLSLKKNYLSQYTTVYFFLDCSLNKNSQAEVLEVISSVNFFKKKIIIKRQKKFGLRKNILNGIKQVFTKHSKIIVLEDDLEVSSNFLQYCNKLLTVFKNNNDIYTISGFALIDFDNSKSMKKNYFISSRRPSSWGWATWRGKWNYLNNNNKTNHKFSNFSYGNDLILMKEKKNINQLDSWAFDWTISHILNSKYCLYPKYSLIKNNGHDNHSSNNFFNIKRKEFNFKIEKFDSFE